MAVSRLHNLSRAVQRSFSTRPSPKQKIGASAAPKPSLHAAAPKPPSSHFDALGLDLSKDALGPESEKRAVIEAFGPSSFTISGVRVAGSVLIMSKFSTLWNVNGMADITSDTFALVQLIVPRPDVVIVGTGAELLVSFVFIFCERTFLYAQGMQNSNVYERWALGEYSHFRQSFERGFAIFE